MCVLLMQGKYSSSSDVWSFAVTFWEILTLGRLLPYGQLTDEQVFANISRRDSFVKPVRPPLCTPEIYDLMAECWNTDESHRPTFREIDMFLRRKNMGYRPENDQLSLPDASAY
jgi:discoidin domain receptor family protein 2